jgi:squalene-associated FAD-dependent desaturase
VKAAVVGGGLAGLAAALELVDAGHDVTLYEARPTLGGAVQTLPERDGDPSPPPDNGQHIALGCFNSYLDFLRRIGSLDLVERRRLALPVIDEQGRVATVGYGLVPLLRYRHIPLADRLRIAWFLARIRRVRPHAGSFGDLVRSLGHSQAAVDRFWDVFIRPALNLPCDEVDAGRAVATIAAALGSGRSASDLVLPKAPLGEIHGEAAGRALEAAGAAIRTNARVDSLDDLDGELVVVAVPPEESARLLQEPEPGLEYSPIVSVHLLFDRRLLQYELAALLGSDAHWVFDRGALMGTGPSVQAPVRASGPVEGVRGNREIPPWPKGAQYLTVVSSGAPELMELRGRELVELMRRQLTERLGDAELLWSRVSREPRATIALRPGVKRPGRQTAREGVVRAGAWLEGLPPTMENAVQSGRQAVARGIACDASEEAAPA